ncbi:hypothetical protein OIO90_003606 [Microbotryomycetes sp. JL221]|nr:hypothetical protein OIO90_003606 [Microbotryomycetes sp. JL221]
MHRFPAIIDALCGQWESNEAELKLRQLLDENEYDRQAQLNRTRGGFLIKALLVFDTVPTRPTGESQTDPGEEPIEWNAFGLKAERLEPHIETALQALAINEDRSLYQPLLLKRDVASEVQGQNLLQMWFSGAHTDVGGGYLDHDLGDISLVWAIEQLQKYANIAFDLEYIASATSRAVDSWAQMRPHKGVTLSRPQPRPLPIGVDPSTNAYIHLSVRFQLPEHLPLERIRPSLSVDELFLPLGPLELELRKRHSKAEKKKTYTTARAKPPAPTSSKGLILTSPAGQTLQPRAREPGLRVTMYKFKEIIDHEVEKVKGAGNSPMQSRAR